VTASGSGLSYQWQANHQGGNPSAWANISNGFPYSGVTNSTLTLSSPHGGFNGYHYRVIVTGTCGTRTSNAATLTINNAPTISSHGSDRFVCAGTPTTFTASASGSSISYQWRVSTNGGSTWTNVSNGGVYSGATTSTLSVTPTAEMHNYQYRLRATNSCGFVESNPRTLNVLSAHSPGTMGPMTAQEGFPHTISYMELNPAAPDASYQWEVQETVRTCVTTVPPGSGWCLVQETNIGSNGAQSSSLTINTVFNWMSGYRFRMRITTACGTYLSPESDFFVSF